MNGRADDLGVKRFHPTSFYNWNIRVNLKSPF